MMGDYMLGNSRRDKPKLVAGARKQVRVWPQRPAAKYYCPFLPNHDEIVDGADVSGFFGGSSTTAAAACLPPLRRCGAGLIVEAGTGSSPFRESRCPSKIAVSQLRLFSFRTAQILAAAPASFSGPATSRSCIPSPLVPSLTTMIGRKAASGALDFDFKSPRHSARNPGSELALPRSTPKSVRWSATFGAVVSSGSASSAGGVDATTSEIGPAVSTLGGGVGSISFAAEGSGGAMIDFDATSGVDGVA